MKYEDYQDINNNARTQYCGSSKNDYWCDVFCNQAVREIEQRAAEFGWDRDKYTRSVHTLWKLSTDLIYALHPDAFGPDPIELGSFWHHHTMPTTYFELNKKVRREYVDKDALILIAADYLSEPDCQNSLFDYVLLDAIIYQEMYAFSITVMDQITPAPQRFAAIWAGGEEGKFAFYTLGLSIVSFALSWLLLPALLIYNLAKENHWTSLALAGLWLLGILSWLIQKPSQIKAKKRITGLIYALDGLYRMLKTRSLSPVRFKQVLTDAADKGVVLDGAVFVLVDRMIIRDPTMFAVPMR